MSKKILQQPIHASTLATSARIGTLNLRHRILMGSMHLGIEGDRASRERLAEFYIERARGGAAMIFTGGVAVLPAGGGDHMYCLAVPEDREDLAYLAERIHEVPQARIALQLFHAGRYAKSSETGMASLAPSAVASKFTGEAPREMQAGEIAAVVAAFAAGARMAQDAGFDAVEVMGSEGYLLNQFLSPLTNQRTDGYGGDLEGRMRLNLEVMAAIRASVGSAFPVVYRMSGADCMPGSTTWEETLSLATRLERAGADALNIGVGWHESRVPTVAAIVPHGGFASIAAGIREVVSIPVIAANRINDGETAARLVSSGWLDFVAPARPWLADPEFARKILEEDSRAINTCLACNQSCLDHNFAAPPTPVSCLVNPRAGNELVRPKGAARRSRRVAVVGAGPAGLEAARAAAERGHAVTLFEAARQAGGQFRMAGMVPGKGEFNETLRYYAEMLRRLSVRLELGASPEAADLARFDEVVLATGVLPHVPQDLPGFDGPNVVTYPQVFRREVVLGRRIVIIGAGGIGCDCAHFLAEQARLDPAGSRFAKEHELEAPNGAGTQITLLSRSGRIARGVGITTRWVLLAELRRLGVATEREFVIDSIGTNGVTGTSPEGSKTIAADTIVLCTGQVSNRALADELEGKVPLVLIGGAKNAKGINAAIAIRDGFEAAYALGGE